MIKSGAIKFKTKKARDSALWKVFSEYIRLRDSDENGYCKCITCGLIKHYKEMDCGHGVPRQHWGTRYNEKNNHAQCKKCNGFEGGRMDAYKEEVNKRYGANTWDLLLASKNGKKYDSAVIEALTKEYRLKVKQLKESRGI